MRITEIIDTDQDVEEATPSKSYCKNTPADKMSASWLASCKSQGYKEREGGKSHKIGKKRKKVDNRIIKGKKYGGPLPHYGSGS
jgi:hypothetical protein